MGPKPSNSSNRFIFTVVDKFSRFLFAFSVTGPSSSAAINCLSSLFTLFGPPNSIHSDRGKAFESNEFSAFLRNWNVIKTRTTPYHPQSNGQIEKMNGSLWKTVQLRLSQCGKLMTDWESELSFALSNMRVLPSRSLSFASPHSAFLAFERHITLEDPVINESSEPSISAPNWLRPGNNTYL